MKSRNDTTLIMTVINQQQKGEYLCHYIPTYIEVMYA